MAVFQARTQRHVLFLLPPESHRTARIAALHQGTAVHGWGTRLVGQEGPERNTAREETRPKTTE